MLNDHYLKSVENIKPSQNFTLQAKLSCEFRNRLNELFNGFGQKREKTVDIWARRLIDSDFTLAEVINGVNYSIENLERVPSYSDFKIICKNNTYTYEDDKLEQEVIDKSNALRDWSNRHNEIVLSAPNGEQKLTDLLNEWWFGVYGGNPNDFGVGLKVFLPIFWQDMLKSKDPNTGKMSIERAIEIGLSKK